MTSGLARDFTEMGAEAGVAFATAVVTLTLDPERAGSGALTIAFNSGTGFCGAGASHPDISAKSDTQPLITCTVLDEQNSILPAKERILGLLSSTDSATDSSNNDSSSLP